MSYRQSTPLRPIPLTGLPPPLVHMDTLPALHNVPRLTLVEELEMNLDMNPTDPTHSLYAKRIKELEEKLESSSELFTREHKIKLYIGGWAKIIKTHARHLHAKVKEQNLNTEAQAQLDNVVADYVAELQRIKGQHLTAPVEKQLISASRAATDLKIAAIDAPPGIMNAVKKMNQNVFNVIKLNGFRGLFMIGRALDNYKIPAARLADKAYVSAYYFFWSVLSSMLYQFLLLAMNPQTYMSFFGMDTDNTTATGKITEVMGGRRKTRKSNRKTRKTRKSRK